MAGSARKVDFVVGGVQKGGSSALASYMSVHPQICMARVKEPHYFNKPENFPPGPPDYAPYHAYFTPSPQHRVLGDATPTYIYWPDTPARLAAYNPALRFVILLRDPAERAYSHWNMFVKESREALPFEDAVRTEAARCADNRPGKGAPTYVDRGFYSRQLANLWRHFPRAQTLVLRSDALKTDPASTLDAIARFLGVDPFPVTHRIEVYRLPYAQPMSATARTFLRDTYRDDVVALEAMLGWDLSAWRT